MISFFLLWNTCFTEIRIVLESETQKINNKQCLVHHCDFFANSDISMCSSFIHFATHISIINSVMGVLTLAQATGYVDRDIATA